MEIKQPERSYLDTLHWQYGPQWRWRVAQQHVDEGLPHCFRRDDPALTRICRYLRWRRSKRRGSAPEDPILAALARADRLTSDGALAGTLKMLVLAGFSRDEICQRTNLDQTTLLLWRQSFFDIETYRTAGSWISWQVIEPEIKAGNHRLAAKLVTAYGGGVHIANAILRAEAGFPKDDVERQQFAEIEMTLRTREALMVPFQSETMRMRQVKEYLQWLLRQDRLAVAKARAEAKTAEEQRRLKVSEYRCEQRAAQEEKKERLRVDRMRERLEIANATVRMREILLADLEVLRRRDREEIGVGVARSPLSTLKWKSSKSVVESTEQKLLLMPPNLAERSGTYTATYLDQGNLVANTEMMQSVTTVLVDCGVTPDEVCIPDLDLSEWTHLS